MLSYYKFRPTINNHFNHIIKTGHFDLLFEEIISWID